MLFFVFIYDIMTYIGMKYTITVQCPRDLSCCFCLPVDAKSQATKQRGVYWGLWAKTIQPHKWKLTFLLKMINWCFSVGILVIFNYFKIWKSLSKTIFLLAQAAHKWFWVVILKWEKENISSITKMLECQSYSAFKAVKIGHRRQWLALQKTSFSRSLTA